MKKTTFCVYLLFITSLFSPFFNTEARVSGGASGSAAQAAGGNQVFIPFISKPEKKGYYVSPSGSDTNPGTYAAPWRTLHKAAQTVTPGMVVYIRGGTYSESVNFSTSGTEAAPISILAYPGENPVIDGNRTIPGAGSGLLRVSGNYVYASGIEVRNSAYDGIQVLGNYDVVSNMYTHHNYKKGIFISKGKYSIVENNRIWWNSTSNEYCKSGCSWSSGISASGLSVSNAVIRNNMVWENWGQGINTYEADQMTIENNTVHDNYAANIYIHDVTNVVCQRNFIYNNPNNVLRPYGSHLGIMMGDERSTPSKNITIINNIFLGNYWNYALYTGTNIINTVLIANNTFVNGSTGGGILLHGSHQNIRITNNVILQDNGLPLIATSLSPTPSFSYNNWSNSARPSSVAGPGDIIGDPLLQRSGDAFSPDWFQLTAAAPAVNHGSSLPGLTVDFYGDSRDAKPDIGAIEYVP